MGDKSRIEWTDATWNPVTGCTRVSEGCRNCYMARTVPRFGQDPWTVVLHPDRLEQPLRWKRPRRIFVNSLSDLFHEDVPDEFIGKVFVTMARATRHTFQVLTKRPDRMLKLLDDATLAFPCGMIAGDALPNVWLGVSIENQQTADERIPLLLQTPAAKRFISAEPLLGPIDLGQVNNPGLAEGQDFIDSLRGFAWTCTGPDYVDTCGIGVGINWVIVGGESGPGARPMHPDWARSIRDQCQAAGVPFFFKQWGEWAPPTAPIKRYVEPVGYPKRCSALRYWMNDRCYVAHAFEAMSDAGTVLRVGKKAAGSMLDGREHKEWPKS